MPDSLDDRTNRRWPAILLAGGASTRFRAGPKAMVEVDGVPAVVRMARTAHAAGFSPCVAVAGPHARATREALGSLGVAVLDNPDWAGGRSGSIQVALEAVADAGGILLWPVDHPFVELGTLNSLWRVVQTDALAVWVIPTYSGRGGHPVLLRRETFEAIRGLRSDGPLRSLMPSFGPQVRRVPVSDPGVVENVDDPEAFAAAVARIRAGGPEARWTVG
ncbi:MAG TPA: nucleotidyltransferase family protein [Thermoplasmata archaeon]|nr:nucleotidyltransferase family protein [Thermoplasmata archaeon]